MNGDQERTHFRSSHRGPLLLRSSSESGLAGPWGPCGEGGRHRGRRVAEPTAAAGSRALLSHKTQETWRWPITGPGSGNRQSPRLTSQDVF